MSTDLIKICCLGKVFWGGGVADFKLEEQHCSTSPDWTCASYSRSTQAAAPNRPELIGSVETT